jgi:hypothetical protein
MNMGITSPEPRDHHYHDHRKSERTKKASPRYTHWFVCWEIMKLISLIRTVDKFNRPWPEPESLSAFRDPQITMRKCRVFSRKKLEQLVFIVFCRNF